MLDAGTSAASISRSLHIHSTTVDRIRSSMRPSLVKPKGGRPSKISKSNKRFIRRLVLSGKAETAPQVATQLKTASNVTVSLDTIRRALKDVGLKAVTKKKKPLLLERHKKARLEFAKRYRNWTVDDWKRVIWSDESKINRLGSDGRKWVWKDKGAGLADNQVTGTLKFGGGHLMMWGCMTYQGVGYACKIDGSMDAKLYVAILDDELQETLDHFGLAVEDTIFQQDNDPKHKSKLATEWFEDHNLEVLHWPAQSPDLNPIEHLWYHLKQELAAYEEEPKSMAELWDRVQETWNRIPVSECTNLIDSMPRRVAAVQKARGGYTKY